MQNIKKKINEFSVENLKAFLKFKYAELIKLLPERGVYIWGSGRLGKFAYNQCALNNISVKGFIDNDLEKVRVDDKVFSCEILQRDDIVIIASLFYFEIAEQIRALNIKNYIYYEELATVLDSFDIYYQAFEDRGKDIQENREKYIAVFEYLADDLSKEIYENIMEYKMSLDGEYTKRAYELSMLEGKQDFDKLIVSRLGDKCCFFDVGGFDGQSTVDFICSVDHYSKIYFFEPDEKIMERAKSRLSDVNDIYFVQAIVGAEKGIANYNALGGGAGNVSGIGEDAVEVVALDDFIENGMSYIKMDIEGYEQTALQGSRKFIAENKPMLSISVYHKPGDIHNLIEYILALNPDYKVYMRHYTKTYADTRCYFI